MHQNFEKCICKDAGLLKDEKNQVVSHHGVRLLDLGEFRQQTRNLSEWDQQNASNHGAINKIEDTVVYAWRVFLLDDVQPLDTTCNEELKENYKENTPVNCHPVVFLQWTFVKVYPFVDNPVGIYGAAVVVETKGPKCKYLKHIKRRVHQILCFFVWDVVGHFIDGVKQHVQEEEKPDADDEFGGVAPDFVASVYEHDQTERGANVLNNGV